MIALDPEDDVLDVAGAARLLGVGRDAIYVACARLEIPHRRVGRVLRFSRTALLRWLARDEPLAAPRGAGAGST